MKPQPKVQVLFDQGSAKVPEDGIIFQPPYYFGATDGVTGVYLPDEGPRMFNGRTGGQLASSIISAAFSTFEQRALDNALRDANSLLIETFLQAGLSLNDSAFLPCACFAVCRIDEEVIEILQGGDCLAIWQLQDNTVYATPNGNYEYEKFLVDAIAKLMGKHEGNRQKMWEEFRPILIKRRRECMNTDTGKICILNGQPQFEKYWQQVILDRDEVKTLILLSNGLVPFKLTCNSTKLAEYVMEHYRLAKLYSVLVNTSRLAAEKIAESHEDFPEATAIALEF